MTKIQHLAAIVAAELALEQAEDNLKTVRAEAGEVSPIKIGERVPGKTSSGGVECQMEVTEIYVHTGAVRAGDNFLSVRLGGKKVKKDGSLANIECYQFLNVEM